MSDLIDTAERRAALGGAARAGARGGAIAAAAVAGALVGFGLRGGLVARPFNAMAALLLGNRARGVWGFDAAVSLLGGVVLLLCCVVAGAALGALIGVVARGARPGDARRRLAAFAVSLVTGAIVVAVMVAHAPDLIGPAPVGALSLGQGIVLVMVAAAAFTSGMGLAR